MSEESLSVILQGRRTFLRFGRIEGPGDLNVVFLKGGVLLVSEQVGDQCRNLGPEVVLQSMKFEDESENFHRRVCVTGFDAPK